MTTALVFLLPAAVALGCLLPGIGHRQLWRDEHATWWASSMSFTDLGKLIQHIDVVLVVYYALMHFWIAAFGDSAAALRFPEAVAMAAAAGLLALLGRRIFTLRTGLLAGLLFAVVPSVTRYGQEARPYAFAVAFTLLSTLLLLRALERPTFKDWAGYAISLPLIGFSHIVSLFILAGHLGLVLKAYRRDEDGFVHWAFSAAALVGLSSLLPIFTQGSQQSGQIAWNNPTIKSLIDYPQQLFGSWATGGALMALGVLGLLATRKYAVLLAPWVLLPPVLTFLTADQLHLFLPRYLLFTVPGWVLLASAAVTRLAGPLTQGVSEAARTGGLRRLGSGILVAVAAAAFTWQALPGISEAREDLPAEPDYRGAAAVVAAGQHSGDGIVFNGVLSERRAMAYELRNDSARPKDVLMQRAPQEIGSYGAIECDLPARCLAGTDRLWLVSTAQHGGVLAGMHGNTAAVLNEQFKVVRTTRLHNVTVVLLEGIR